MQDEILDEVTAIAKRAKQAAGTLGQSTTEERNEALQAMADGLRASSTNIIAANERDMDAARGAGTPESLLDRLMLDEGRIQSMASALEDLIALPDPLGRVLYEGTMYNDIALERVSVPLGVVAVVYEARPNVTADAAGICLKSGNACILRGGSLAAQSNEAIAEVLRDAAAAAGLPKDSIQSINSTSREATDALMQLHGLVDVLIPRGGAGLIAHCVEHSKVPVIETGTGNCHVYIHNTADPEMALSIVHNAKCRRLGVCNAAESLLFDEGLSDDVGIAIMKDLADAGILLHLDERAMALTQGAGIAEASFVAATEEDWGTEYLGPEISVRYIPGVSEAIDHVNRYGTHHSESIVAADTQAAERFLAGVDAAAVYHNASTAFTDGGQFGLGAEIGISTQKLHARGPFALEALTSYKYVLRGDGQVRD